MIFLIKMSTLIEPCSNQSNFNLFPFHLLYNLDRNTILVWINGVLIQQVSVSGQAIQEITLKLILLQLNSAVLSKNLQVLDKFTIVEHKE